jgi:FAD/FMN-containing dehydrogenase
VPEIATLLARLAADLDGALLTRSHPSYATACRTPRPAPHRAQPRSIVRCASVSDVVAAVRYARAAGERLVARGGGHCFAGRSTCDGVVMDMSGLNSISVDDAGVATIGAGASLGQVYTALQARGRSLPGGCGATVGIAGLTLGGGIGLLGRRYGLTCDRLVGADIVLADGRLARCDADHEADLFWALRGAGGGQFGVVTSLRFDTVAEPLMSRISAHHTPGDVADLTRLVAAWQRFAPHAPDEVTVNLTIGRAPPGGMRVDIMGASMLDEAATRHVLAEFTSDAGGFITVDVQGGIAYHRLKSLLDDPRDADKPVRSRSEFHADLHAATVARLLTLIARGDPIAPRRITFTAMGGAYNRVAADATAFAHRDARFLLEHVGPPSDPWVDASWSAAHVDGSGGVYPNFPDTELHDHAAAYHGANHAGLVAVKDSYDPEAFFDFPQAIQPSERTR